MTIEKGRISSSQLVYLMIAFTLGSAGIIPPGQAAGNNAWLAILLGGAEALLFFGIYAALARRFSGKTFVEMSRETAGSYLGTVVSIAYLWFLFHIGSLVIEDFSTFFTTVIMPETPSIVFGFCILFGAVYAVRSGIEVIARCSQILVIVIFVSVGITVVFLINEYDFSNFLPVMDIPISDLLIAAHGAAVFPFGEMVAFLMIVPCLNKAEEGRKSLFMGLLAGVLLLFVLSLRNIAALGVTAGVSTYPSFRATRLINVGEVFTRMELIITINILTTGFIELALLLYGTSVGLAQVVKLKSCRTVVIPVAVLMLILSEINFPNLARYLEFSTETYLYYHPVFELGIPVVILLLAGVRRLPRQNR